MSNGKGDKPRPVSNRSQYYTNWEGIDWGRESPWEASLTALSPGARELHAKSREAKSLFSMGDGDGDYFIVPEASPFPEPPE